MHAEKLKERFLEMLPPPLPNDWEVEENIEPLDNIPEEKQELILGQVQAIWPVSNSLCYSYLACADTALSCLSEDQVSGWVATILDIYEKKGLKAAQNFMADVESNYLCMIRGETGIRLSDVSTRLLPYAKAIWKSIESLEPAPEVFTDTGSVYLPRKLAIFRSEEENYLLYKLMATCQLGLIRAGTYNLTLDSGASTLGKLRHGRNSDELPEKLTVTEFWNLFPDPRLAEDIFTLAEGQRIGRDLVRDYPGLWRDTVEIRHTLASYRPPISAMSDQSRSLEILCRYLIDGGVAADPGINRQLLEPIIGEFDRPAGSGFESAVKSISLYDLIIRLEGPYQPVEPLIYLGRLRPDLADRVRMRKRAERKDKFIKALAATLAEKTGPTSLEQEGGPESGTKRARIEGEEAAALLIRHEKEEKISPTLTEHDEATEASQHLILAGPELELSQELKELGAEIRDDLGQIPDDYITAAFGIAGQGYSTESGGSESEGDSLSAAITYDEWDFRRAGFRKDWCLLNEKKINPVRGTFIRNTLDKYKGLLIKLKKQFEMLRTAERLLKRQRDGDDIDLDAVIESISDQKAGRPESEKLFVKLRRDERDIAVLFLIDMSASTEGWVGEALKEALILMGEALDVLGDRFAIAGFSGMRRTRADFYHIKDFAEVYGEEIREKIAAIAPQEYTRMGPPLRHATTILNEVEARVKLLIVLSDGKPEDYDDYKGEYAIEDTRHALIEAKAAGIHPFCITIDQQAHDYNAHMYGEVNYIFLGKVSDLPIRMPAIYRNLTS